MLGLFVLNNSGPPTTLQLGFGHHLPSHCLHENYPQLVGDDRDRVQNFQVGLLQHVAGDPLPVVGDPLDVVGDPLRVVGDPLV